MSRRLLASAAAVAAALLTAPLAGAAPQTFPDPAGSGASVTVSTTDVYPGQRLQISGSGFKGSEPAGPGGTPPAGGVPLVAIKPYDIDLASWSWGGASAYNGPDDAKIWFAPDAVNGNWSGYIDIPTTLTQAGVLTGPDEGKNWLRILSGAFSTGGAGPFTGNTSVPITYKVPFTVSDRVALGLTSPSGTLFQLGKVFRPNTSITPRGRDFPASKPITATLDDVAVHVTEATSSPLALVPAMTNADGTFPATTRLTIPAGTTAGTRQLAFKVDGETITYPITVVAPPTTKLVTSTVRPGGRVVFNGTGFIGVGGAGQKVAIVVNEIVLACLTASAEGSLAGSALLPTAQAEGATTVGFNAGTSCLGPTAAQNDLPATRVTQPVSVSASAPTVSAPAMAAIGGMLAVAGAGFPSSATLSATIGGQPAGSVVADAAGNLAGSLTVPASLGTGAQLLVLATGDIASATMFTATATETKVPLEQPPPAGVPVTPANPASPAVKTVIRKGARLAISFAATPANGTTVTVKTAKKLKTSARATPKIVTLAKTTLTKTGAVILNLTANGKRLLRRYRTAKLLIIVVSPRSIPTTTILTLRS